MNFKKPFLYWLLFNVVFIIIISLIIHNLHITNPAKMLLAFFSVLFLVFCPAAIPFLNGVNKLF